MKLKLPPMKTFTGGENCLSPVGKENPAVICVSRVFSLQNFFTEFNSSCFFEKNTDTVVYAIPW